MAAEPVRYSGQGFSLQRDKGRFVLPATFRKAVKESSAGNVLCLARHDRWKCLTGFGKSRCDSFEAQLDREEAHAEKTGALFDRDMRALQLNGFAEVPFDDSGRFVLPTQLAEAGGIDDEIYFQGAGTFFALFAPAELGVMASGFEGAQAACKQLRADALDKAAKS